VAIIGNSIVSAYPWGIRRGGWVEPPRIRLYWPPPPPDFQWDQKLFSEGINKSCGLSKMGPYKLELQNLWAPRFSDLLAIRNKFWVICFGNGKISYCRNENPQQKAVDARINPLYSPPALACSLFCNTVINGMHFIKFHYLYICVSTCQKLTSS